MKKYIKILMNKVEEFEKEKQLHNDTIALNIMDAKINSLKWAIQQANGLERSSDKCHIQNVMASYSIEQNLNIFDIANMSIKQSKNGFSIWMLEPCEDGELRKRWIVDASNVLKDARIELSNKDGREFRSVYVADENCIEIQRR